MISEGDAFWGDVELDQEVDVHIALPESFCVLNTTHYTILIKSTHGGFGRGSLLESSAAEFLCCVRAGAGESPAACSSALLKHWQCSYGQALTDTDTLTGVMYRSLASSS